MYIYDLVASVLIGISHVLLYVQLIRYNRLSYTMVFALSVIFMTLLGIVVTVTGYPEFNIILLLLFLLTLGLMKDELTFMQNVYFALVSIVLITLVRLVLMELGMKLFMLSPLNLYLWTGSVIHLVVSTILLGSILLLRSSIQKFAQFIVESPLYFISYVLLIIGLMIELILTIPSSVLLSNLNQQYGQLSHISAYILFFILLLIVLIGSHLAKERILEEQQQRLDIELLDYVGKLELMHDELASFRHDYINVLLSLDEGIRTKNIEQIARVYEDVITPTSKLMDNHELETIKLSRITMPEVKSMLHVKVTIAEQKQVKVMVDIPDVMEGIAMPMISFIRIISILVDNAIEEAVRSKEKVMQLAFFEMEDVQYFIVRNSCQQTEIDLQKMFEKNYTKKENNEGYGLFSLKRMIDKTKNATLETTFIAPFFTQTLILKKE